MKPDVQKVMAHSFGRMVEHVAPHIGSEYALGSAAVMGLMMFQTATEFERGAEIRVQEHRAMRALFASASGQVGDADLARRLEEASKGTDSDLRISVLDQTNDALAALLIELHEHVESQEGAWARDLEAAIWAELARAADARKLPHPMVG